MRSQKKTPTIRLLSPLLLVPGFRFLASPRRYAFSEFNDPCPQSNFPHSCISPPSSPSFLFPCFLSFSLLLFLLYLAPFWFCSYHPTCARPTLLLIYPAFHIFDALLSGVTVRPGEYYLPALPNPVLSLFVAFGYFPVISVLVFLSLLPLSLLRFARYEFCPRLGVVSR